MRTRARHYIGGVWTEGDGPLLRGRDPATEEIIWEGPSAGEAQVEAAVAFAKGASDHWGKSPLRVRIQILERFRDALDRGREDLAVAISRDTGKPLWESRAETGSMIGKVDFSLDSHGERCSPETLEIQGASGTVRYRPHGTVAVLSPFNLPGHLANAHIVPALLAGNTVVLKPSELVPLAAEHLLSLWEEADLPPGVLNLLQGGGDTGKRLSSHPGLDGIFFTGSSRTGLALRRQLAGHPEKILALEMGGNNPLGCFKTDNVDAAAYIAVLSSFVTAGQRCTCARRLIVPEGGEGDRFVEKVVSLTQGLRPGGFTEEPEPFMGPVITPESAGRLLGAQEDLVRRKGRPLLKMSAPSEGGAFLRPGIIDMTGAVDRPDEEYFGPLLQVIRVPDFDALVREANRTRYGLAAGLLSDRRERFDAFYHGVKAGIINWNRPTTGASGRLPFGGVGLSGNHRPSGYLAADYCSRPVASLEEETLSLPENLLPGISW